MKRTIEQNNQLYALLTKLGIDTETKSEMVLSYTNGRTVKSSEMHRMECQLMINDLRQRSTFDVRADKMRKKIISMFIKQGYTLPNGKIDIVAVDVWSQKYGHLHKPFNCYKYEELPKLVSQAEQMYYSHLKTI